MEGTLGSTIVEYLNPISCEKVEDGKGIKVSGSAMPVNETSRNRVFYRPESVKKAARTLGHKSMLFNHDSMYVVGHTETTKMSDDGKTLEYKADINPDSQVNGNSVAVMVERGDVTTVSIQAVVSNAKFIEDKDRWEVDVVEFVELSLAPVPGFGKATVSMQSLSGDIIYQQLCEAFKMTDKEEKKEEEKNEEEEVVDEPDVMAEFMDRFATFESEIKETLKTVNERLDAIEKKAKSKNDDDEDDEDDDKDKDKKKKKNKQSLPSKEDLERASRENVGGDGDPTISTADRIKKMRHEMWKRNFQTTDEQAQD